MAHPIKYNRSFLSASHGAGLECEWSAQGRPTKRPLLPRGRATYALSASSFPPALWRTTNHPFASRRSTLLATGTATMRFAWRRHLPSTLQSPKTKLDLAKRALPKLDLAENGSRANPRPYMETLAHVSHETQDFRVQLGSYYFVWHELAVLSRTPRVRHSQEATTPILPYSGFLRKVVLPT